MGTTRASRQASAPTATVLARRRARDWLNYPDNLAAVAERLRGVVIESRPAVEVMLAHDGEATVIILTHPICRKRDRSKTPAI
jgi:hypothetical protein